MLQDLQGQAGGGYSMSPCSDDNFLFQAGGVDRCLNQIYSVYLDSWCDGPSLPPRTKKWNKNHIAFLRKKCSLCDVWRQTITTPIYWIFKAELFLFLTKNKLNCRVDWFLSVLYSVSEQTGKREQPKRKSGQIINVNNTFWVRDDHSVCDLDRMNGKYLSHTGARSHPLPLILNQWV